MITFRGGVHPYDGKEYTKDKQIEKLEASQEVVFLMKQQIISIHLLLKKR